MRISQSEEFSRGPRARNPASRNGFLNAEILFLAKQADHHGIDFGKIDCRHIIGDQRRNFLGKALHFGRIVFAGVELGDDEYGAFTAMPPGQPIPGDRCPGPRRRSSARNVPCRTSRSWADISTTMRLNAQPKSNRRRIVCRFAACGPPQQKR